MTIITRAMYEDCLCSIPFPFRISYVLDQVAAISYCTDQLTQEQDKMKGYVELAARVTCVAMDAIDLISHFLIVYLPAIAPLQEASPLLPLIAMISLVVAEALSKKKISSFTVFTLGFRLENVFNIESTVSASMLGSIADFFARQLQRSLFGRKKPTEEIREADNRTRPSRFSKIVRYAGTPNFVDLLENVGGSIVFAKLAYTRCSDTLKWKMVSVLNAIVAMYSIHLCRVISFYAMAPLSKKISYIGKNMSNFFEGLRPASCHYWQVLSNAVYIDYRMQIMQYNEDNAKEEPLTLPPTQCDYALLSNAYEKDPIFSKYVCTLNQGIIRYPAFIQDGTTVRYYELFMLRNWVRDYGTNPCTQQRMNPEEIQVDLAAQKKIEERMRHLGIFV